MSNDKKINYIEFPATNFEDMKSFYGDVFNWSFQHFGDEYLAFNDGSTDGGFYLSEKKASVSDGAALVIFYALNLEVLQGEIEAAGGKICVPIFSFPGGRRFHFTDPHGNELAVWTDQVLS